MNPEFCNQNPCPKLTMRARGNAKERAYPPRPFPTLIRLNADRFTLNPTPIRSTPNPTRSSPNLKPEN